MNAEEMIRYVESVASQQVPPPYHFPGVTAQGFVWEAQMAPIQAYCDRIYNLGEAKDRGFTYRPAPMWPYVLLMMIDYPVMISCNPAVLREKPKRDRPISFADRGAVKQREVFVAIPLIRYGEGPAGLLLNTMVEWALPFIVVENPMSAICGREMVGLEKLLAEITFGESTYPESFEGSVKLPGWPSRAPVETLKQTSEEMSTATPFLDVDTKPALPTFRGSPGEGSPWSLLRSRAARNGISDISSATDLMATLSEDLFSTAMRTVALKQIRDAANPKRALYQALVGCRSRYSNIEDFRFYNEQDVAITFHDHGSFAQIHDLVLPPPGEDGKRPKAFPPKAGFTFKADIDFDDMRTLHTFKVDLEPGEPERAAIGDLTSPWMRPWRGFFSRKAQS